MLTSGNILFHYPNYRHNRVELYPERAIALSLTTSCFLMTFF